MFENRKIIAVVPCLNEERQLPRVIEGMPPIIDTIAVIDDGSTDETVRVASELAAADPRVVLLRHERNQGVGAAIATGYKYARDHDYDIAVVMAGDGQMDPRNLVAVLQPVARDEVDYAKGNRLITHQAYKRIPFTRFVGNAVLSLLTKVASGYWHVADSQSGYTAIGRTALQTIEWDHMYARYGQPNDLLVRLNIYDFRVRDIPMPPVYGQGEVSKMRKRKVVFTLSALLVKLFLWRLKEKYVVRDFHPLVFFWAMAFLLTPVCAGLGGRLVYFWIKNGYVPAITLLGLGFCLVTAMQSVCFALLFDMQANRHLR